jgi:REP element-mobilizing transposase RayT
MYPAVTLNGHQALQIAKGFATRVCRSCYTIWGCSILPEHTHLVIARHRFKVEHIINQLKGAATRQLLSENCHPLGAYAEAGGRPPRMWASHEWKVYLDSEQSIKAAIHYVEENPVKEGKLKQCWSFVTPFAGLPGAGWTTYH